MNQVESKLPRPHRVEHQIIDRLLQQKRRSLAIDLRSRADRVIWLGAMIVAVAMLGSLFQELMWAVLAGGSVISLGVR